MGGMGQVDQEIQEQTKKENQENIYLKEQGQVGTRSWEAKPMGWGSLRWGQGEKQSRVTGTEGA